jgi:GxxExxY protein
MAMQHSELTERIIGCAYDVYNTLGAGFLENVYERSLLIELQFAGLIARQQVPLNVYYREELVGQYFADIVVNQTVVIELKAGESLSRAHEVQLVNYLVATGMPTGLLINFGPEKVAVRRKVRQLKSPSCQS